MPVKFNKSLISNSVAGPGYWFCRFLLWGSLFLLGGTFSYFYSQLVSAENGSFQAFGAPRTRCEQGVDCGPLSLYFISILAGKKVSLESLQTATKTNDTGTTFLDLKFGATALGFDVQPCNLSFKRLNSFLTTPSGVSQYAILYLEPGHFVAAFGKLEGKVRIVDRALGIREVDEQELGIDLGWKGFSILLAAP